MKGVLGSPVPPLVSSGCGRALTSSPVSCSSSIELPIELGRHTARFSFPLPALCGSEDACPAWSVSSVALLGKSVGDCVGGAFVEATRALLMDLADTPTCAGAVLIGSRLLWFVGVIPEGTSINVFLMGRGAPAFVSPSSFPSLGTTFDSPDAVDDSTSGSTDAVCSWPCCGECGGCCSGCCPLCSAASDSGTGRFPRISTTHKPPVAAFSSSPDKGAHW
mmetsp:Transcript_119905/g.238730  ORF Transcript_119905/g.238730 Transcript_119905/m.238730 type:complete len:220 (-) Transcript_119905:63-722(-)